MKFLRATLLLFAINVIFTANVAPAAFPEVKDLPIQTNLPDVMTMDDGTKVTTPAQWRARREEMKAIIEHYELGHAPPPPGNVSGKDIQSKTLLNGTVKFRLVHLSFGRGENWDWTSRFLRRAKANHFRPLSIRPSL
jgi:hypothetical protein